MPNEINNVWGSEGSTTFLTLPSGQTVYAKMLGMEEVLAAGLSSEMDVLSQFVVKEHLLQDHKKKGELPDVDVEAVMKDPELFGRLIMMVDKLMPEIIAQPPTHLHFEVLEDGKTTRKLSKEDRAEIDRKAGISYTYTDKIPMNDKWFLFQWTTGQGVGDPTTFREGPQSSMVSVGNVKKPPRKTQPPSRGRQR
jgi:hypothetical protein